MARTILVALGGNAIKQSDEAGTSEEQFKNCRKTMKHIAEIVQGLDKGDRLIITHGNGPQVGNLMVQHKLAEDVGRLSPWMS
jgi:carbamate kinase